MRLRMSDPVIGWNFLGYWFSPVGLAVARQTVELCAARVSRLDEQGAASSRIGTYGQRWRRWVRAGLGGMGVELGWGARPGMMNGMTGSVIPPLCVVSPVFARPAVGRARQISQYSGLTPNMDPWGAGQASPTWFNEAMLFRKVYQSVLLIA